MLDIAAHLIRPNDYNALELAIFRLLHGHCGKQVPGVAPMLSAKRHVPCEDGLDVGTGKPHPSQRVDLVFDPHDRCTHRAAWGKRSQRSEHSITVCVRSELQAVDDDLRLVAVGSFPVDQIRAIALLPAWTLADTGDDVLGKPALQSGRDHGDVAALTPCDRVG